MDELNVRPILESLLFASDVPLRLEALVEMLPEFNRETILRGIEEILGDSAKETKGVELVEVAGGYQFRTKPYWAEWVGRLRRKKTVRLSQSALETLAIIAYRQPIIRPEIEQVRGVDSGWVIRSLMEKGLVKMMGRKDLPGRPIIYGTTKAFLELFGLKAVSDMPTLKEVAPPRIEGDEEPFAAGTIATEEQAKAIPAASAPLADSFVDAEIKEVFAEIDSSGNSSGDEDAA